MSTFTLSMEPGSGALIDVPRMLRFLEAQAASYYPDLEMDGAPWQSRLIRSHRRSNSEVYEISLFRASAERRVIVKVPVSRRILAAGARPVQKDRPRISPRPDPSSKGKYEFQALQAIHDHFSKHGGHRFGTIRPLESLPPLHVLVMEKGPEHDLSRYMRTANRMQRPFLRFPLSAAFSGSGLWLRHFHELTTVEHPRLRSRSRDEFVEVCSHFWQFLIKHSGRSTELTRLQHQFLATCRRHLPAILELGVAHGDYAPRNVLVTPSGQVTGFDTQARWKAPIYEDIGHFLVAVKASGPNVCSRGLFFSHQTVQQLEESFLRGYFGDRPPPIRQIRLFEMQRLLEWWTSLIFVHQQATGYRKWMKRSRAVLWQNYLRCYLRRALHEANDPKQESDPSPIG